MTGPFICKKCNKEYKSWQELYFHIQLEKINLPGSNIRQMIPKLY